MQLTLGDSLEKLKELGDNSVDSVVTDPPYGLAFMGKKWDYDVPSVDLWREVLRVLKPGGHLLSFGGTRTYHRMVVNIEDAGFEIRDQIMWIYGSGFPKSLDVSKAIDKAAGAEREVTGEIKTRDLSRHGGEIKGDMLCGVSRGSATIERRDAPATPDAKRWQGWGTALKPANEPIVLARKPLEKGLTVAENVQKWGTGAINVDAGRIGYGNENIDFSKVQDGNIYGSSGIYGKGEQKQTTPLFKENGRWPANVLFDEAAAAMLDEQSGQQSARGGMPKDKSDKPGQIVFAATGGKKVVRNDSGGASRFFYVAKASKRERNAGLDLFDSAKIDSGSCVESTGLAQLILRVTFALIPNSSIVESGENIMAIFPRECLSTTKTMIQAITELKTWSLWMRSHTSASMKDAVLKLMDGTSHVKSVANSSEWMTLIGILADKVGSATDDVKHATLEKLLKLNDKNEWQSYKSGHPTVKPVRLMEYLIKLVTPPNGTVLDPFMGSGTTGCAAVRLGFQFIGIEREQEYVEIAKRRIEKWKEEKEEICLDEKNQLTMNI